MSIINKTGQGADVTPLDCDFSSRVLGCVRSSVCSLSGRPGVLFLLVLLFFFSVFTQQTMARSAPIQVIKVGAYENPPKVYTNSSGDIVGIFPDILKVIAEEEGWVVEYIHGSWEQCLKRLENGEIDMMIDIAHSREREGRFSFSGESVFLNWGSIYTKHGFTAESLLDLKGKTVATVREDIHTVGENGIEKLAVKFDLQLNFVPVDSYREVLEAVHEGRVDGGVVNRLFGTIAEKKYAITESPIVFNPVQLKFAFPKHSEKQLLGVIDRHLNVLKSDPKSVFHRIVNSYLAGSEYDLDSYSEIRPIKFDEQELAWLRGHPSIRLGVDPAYAPYSFRDKDGTYRGLAVDVFDLMARHLGVGTEIASGLTWPQILEGVRDTRLDVVLTAVETEERQEYLNFTEVFLPTPLVIMTREDDDQLEGPEDLGHKKIALVKGYSSADRILAGHPDIVPVMVDTPLAGLLAVSVGDADCYVGVLGITDFLMRQHGISNLKVAASYDMLLSGQRIGIRKDWPELVTILDKVLLSISEKKRVELFQTWISDSTFLEGSAALQDENRLSASETAWVKEHRDILLGVDPEFAPFEFYDKNGEYQGIVAEYVKILNSRLGLNMQVVTGLSWNQAIEKAKKGEVDALPCVGRTEERQNFLNFSKPYLNYHRVILTRTSMPFIASVDDIRELNVAVQADTSHEGFLLENTDIKPITYPTLLETLKAVSDGKAEAMVGNLASSIYWIRKENLTNLKVAGPVTYSSEKLHFAVRKDMPELVAIIEKGLASISPEKEKRLRDRWVHVDFDPGLDPKVLAGYFLKIAAVVAFVLSVILAWNYRLKKEIVRRKEVESDLTYRLGYERLLFGMASNFINLKASQIDSEVESALARTVEFVSADSAYIFDIDSNDSLFLSHAQSEKGEIASNSYCGMLSDLPFGASLREGEMIEYWGGGESPDHEEVGSDLLTNLLATTSSMIVPMSIGGELMGVLWIGSRQKDRRWSRHENKLLETVGIIIINALERVRIDQELREHQDMLEQRIEHRTADLGKANKLLQQEIEDRRKTEEEKNRLQVQLFQAQKMESIGTLAGGIAHDFNNILTAMLGYAEMAREVSEKGSSVATGLDRILEAGIRAKGLVQQILTFSRQAETEPQPIDPVKVLEETVNMLRPTIPTTIEIVEDISSGISHIFADQTQVNQVLVNICTNAYHAMEETGGTLRLGLSEEGIGSDDLLHEPTVNAGSFVRFSITDSGPGIPENIRAKIFDPFFTTKETGKGTGMGLSIVHGIVKTSGGFIRLESVPGRGTTFHVYLPSYEIYEPEEPDIIEQIRGGDEKILFVDDEEIIANMTKEMLESLGYGVTTENSGGEALKTFLQQPDMFDLVITDQTMSGMTGAELSRNLLEIRPDIPIILCTGYSSIINREKAEAIGIKGFTLKPFSRGDLGLLIRKILD